MAHTCPTCSSQCYCDGEDTFIGIGMYESPGDLECQHECEVEDFDDDSFDCMECGTCASCVERTMAHAEEMARGDRQAVSEALVAPLFDTEKK